MAVTLKTSYGDLLITLEWREAPRTARNFMELCKSGYYDGVLFHRVVPGFMCQTGDPLGDGSGGESIYGPTFEDEISARLSHAGLGVVAMVSLPARPPARPPASLACLTSRPLDSANRFSTPSASMRLSA